ncbi:hypothetical protein CDD83_11166 [Cordyceps sp. RAO-2017]|nr:hypothetical protein CDD83_11166 [Cordyceps sp. RAO-2017]
MPWAEGHKFQGQVLFPGAGYMSLAVEATKAFVQDRPVKLLEVRDMNIPKALVIGEDDGVELLFTIRSKILPSSVGDDSTLEAEFVAYSCSDKRVLDKTCDGRLFVHLGRAQPGDLPPNPVSRAELTPLSTERFYHAVSRIDLDYDGPFRALSSISRSWGQAKATASWDKGELDIGCALHPALLDNAFQTGLATFVSTAENAMGGPFLPVGIRRALIDPNFDYGDSSGTTNVDIGAVMTEASPTVVEVDIGVCADNACGVQVDGLILKMIAEPEAADDRNLFAKTIWNLDCAYSLTFSPPVRDDVGELAAMSDVYERLTLFYMQNLLREVPPAEFDSAKWHHRELLRFIHATSETVRGGRHPVLQKAWLDDNRDTISRIVERYPGNINIEMLTAVGENLPSVVRGQSGMIEHMLQGDLLGRLYRESSGLVACNQHIAQLMRQISHKHPRTKIIEIGAGTGGTTMSALDALGDAYSSYTCTDISASFFNGLSDRLPQRHAGKVDFKVYDVEKTPAAEDIGSYSVVLAANVLHATRKLSETVRNARALLRPGGYLIAVEVTGQMLRETGLMGGLEGWWLGAGEGRSMGPGVSPRDWDNILEQNGFSGIDCIFHDNPNVSRHSCSVFASQAVDDKFKLLRDPLANIDLIPESRVLIVGGRTLPVSKLVRRAEKMLSQWSSDITTCSSIDELDAAQIHPGTFVLCLSDLDRPFFAEPPTAKQLDNLQEMLGSAKQVLWVTCGRLLDDPYSNMMVGVGRALAVELPHVNIHYLDFDRQQSWDVEILLREMLRMMASPTSKADTHGMLWVEEPEIVVRKDEILVPRIMQDTAANESLNAKRRRISKSVDSTRRITVVKDSISLRPVLVADGPLDIPVGFMAFDPMAV